MPRSDDSFDRLRAAIDELAAADAADLLAEARIEARARVRASLTDALAHSMLERLHEQLGAPTPAAPTPRQTASPPKPRRTDSPATPTRRRARRPASPAPTAEPAEPRAKPAQSPTEPRASPARPPTEPSAEPAWYVYGVVSADAQLSDPLTGVDPRQPVTLLREGALAAVASQVPIEEFDEVRLREHLADMTWVEATARAHETVLDQVAAEATVIPMRMCTVYRTDAGAREMLEREAQPLQDALDHLHGQREWGVKVFAGPDSAGAGDADDGQSGDSPGAAYMARKQDERARREHALELAEEAAVQVHDRLSAIVTDALVLPPQRPEASGHEGEMILNGVYLVAEEDTERFHAGVRSLATELAPDGIELEPTGPWPAYNFVPGAIGAAW